MRPAIEDRAAALDQLLAELQDGNAWDSTISLLIDYADLVRDLMQDRAALVAEIVADLRKVGDDAVMKALFKTAANYIEAKFGGPALIKETDNG